MPLGVLTEVKYTRSESGSTSEAYAGAVVANCNRFSFWLQTGGCDFELTIPHSKPNRISPTRRTGLFGAKKTMNRKQLMTPRVHSTTFLGPKAVTSQPLRIVPKMEPQPCSSIRVGFSSKSDRAYRFPDQDQIASQQ